MLAFLFVTFAVMKEMAPNITIHRGKGYEDLIVPVTQDSKRVLRLMGDDYVELSFILEESVYIPMGSSITLPRLEGAPRSFGGEFVTIKEQSAEPYNGAYKYALRFDAPYHAWKNKVFKYSPDYGSREASWTLTAELKVFLDVFVLNLDKLGYEWGGNKYTYVITPFEGQTESFGTAKCITFNNTSIYNALSMIAEAWKCEWWIEDNEINFGRCEFGELEDLELGVNVSDIKPSGSKDTKATRIYCFGSSKNIPYKYRKKLDFTCTQDGYAYDSNRPISLDMIAPDRLTTKVIESYTDYTPIRMLYRVNGEPFKEDMTFVKSDIGTDSTFEYRQVLYSDSGRSVRHANVSMAKVSVHGWVYYEEGKELKPFLMAKICSGNVGDSKTGKVLSYVNFEVQWDGDVVRNSYRYFKGEATVTCNDYFEQKNSVLEISDHLYFELSINNKSAYNFVLDDVKMVATYEISEVSAGIGVNGENIIFVLEDKRSGYKDGHNLDENFNVKIPFGLTKGERFTLEGIILSKIPVSYFTPSYESDIVKNGVLINRLMLPNTDEYPYNNIDAEPDLTDAEIIEQVVVNEDIYPRMDCAITEVSTKEYTDTEETETGEEVKTKWDAYQFKLEGLNFKREYILENKTLSCTFMSGSLNGMTFELSFNPEAIDESDPRSQVFEIIRNEDYGRKLPDLILMPQRGDKVVLFNYDTSFVDASLVGKAEEELAEKMKLYMEKLKIDNRTYQVTMLFDPYGEDIVQTFSLGSRVNLKEPTYFKKGFRESRVIGYELHVDIPYDNPTYTIGESSSYSLLGELSDKIESLVMGGATPGSTMGGGSNVQLVKLQDTKTPTDSNVYSALRSDKNYLSRIEDSIANGLITFMKGLKAVGMSIMEKLQITDKVIFGNFNKGISGGIIDKEGDAELNSLTLRESLTVPKLNYLNVEVIAGNTIRSAGGGKVERFLDYEIEGEHNYYIKLKLDDGEIGKVCERDYCKGFYHLLEGNDEVTDDKRFGEETVQGFKAIYFVIEKVYKDFDSLNDEIKSFLSPQELANVGYNQYCRIIPRYITDKSYTDTTLPQEGMDFAVVANDENTSRQSMAYETTSYLILLNNLVTWKYTTDNIVYIRGNLNGFSIMTEKGLIELEGDGIAFGRAYMWGNIKQYDRVYVVSQQLFKKALAKEDDVTIEDIGTSNDKAASSFTPYLWGYWQYIYNDGSVKNSDPYLFSNYSNDGKDADNITISASCHDGEKGNYELCYLMINGKRVTMSSIVLYSWEDGEYIRSSYAYDVIPETRGLLFYYINANTLEVVEVHVFDNYSLTEESCDKISNMINNVKLWFEDNVNYPIILAMVAEDASSCPQSLRNLLKEWGGLESGTYLNERRRHVFITNINPTAGAGRGFEEISEDPTQKLYTFYVTKGIGINLNGSNGKNGLSAYEVAVKNGYQGTEAEWLTSLIGENGKSVAGIKEFYSLGSSEAPLTEWTETIQVPTAEQPYLWNKETSYDTDGNEIVTTTPVIIGNYSKDGKGISQIEERYFASNSSTIPEETSGQINIASTGFGKDKPYLFNKQRIVYDDNTYGAWSTWQQISYYGQDGEDGVTYVIETSYDAIHIDASGTYSPTSLTIERVQLKNGQRTVITSSTSLQYKIDNGEWKTLAIKVLSSTIIKQAESSIRLRMLMGASSTVENPTTLIATKTIPIIRDGKSGNDGKNGKTPRPRGEWNANDLYVNNGSFRDIVIYNNSIYAVKDGVEQVPLNSPPPNDAYWDAANEFQFVATDLLLAKLSIIENLALNTLKAYMRDEEGNFIMDKPTIEIDGQTGALTARIFRHGVQIFKSPYYNYPAPIPQDRQRVTYDSEFDGSDQVIFSGSQWGVDNEYKHHVWLPAPETCKGMQMNIANYGTTDALNEMYATQKHSIYLALHVVDRSEEGTEDFRQEAFYADAGQPPTYLWESINIKPFYTYTLVSGLLDVHSDGKEHWVWFLTNISHNSLAEV